jgi:hypothetical protein
MTTITPAIRTASPSIDRAVSSAFTPAGAGVVSPWPWIFRVAAIACMFATMAIHATVIEPHLIEWMPAGSFFLALTVLQGCLGLALLVAPSRWMYRVALAATGATLVLWAVSRTMGLPFGPEAFNAEAVGRPDIIATFLEGVGFVALLALVRGWRLRGAPWPNRPARWVSGVAVLAAVAALTGAGVTAGGEHDHGGGAGHDHGAAVGASLNDSGRQAHQLVGTVVVSGPAA